MKSDKQKLCILGIGDAGIRPAHLLAGKGVKAIYMGIGNSGKRMRGINIIEFNSPKREFIPGVTRFLVPDMSVEANIPPDVDALLRNDFHFLIFAGLGGYTGTKLTALVVEKLVAANRPFKCIVTYPFRFEGKSRAQNAEIFLDVFGNHPNVEVVHLDDFCRNKNMLLRQAFNFATLKMAMIANDLPGLNVGIEFPEYEKPDEKVELREARLQLLSETLKKP